MADALPCQCHGFAERLLIHQVQSHAGAARTSPRTILGSKYSGMIVHELMLLVRRELDHPAGRIGMNRREDLPVDAEVRMPHVRPLEDILHSNRDTPEAVGSHYGAIILTHRQ